MRPAFVVAVLLFAVVKTLSCSFAILGTSCAYPSRRAFQRGDLWNAAIECTEQIKDFHSSFARRPVVTVVSISTFLSPLSTGYLLPLSTFAFWD